MVAARFTLLLILLVVCSIGPGFFFVRRMRWNPLEKLCGAIALSLFLIYLTTFGIYLLRPPVWCHWIVTGLCVVLGKLASKDLTRLVHHRQVRRTAIGFLLLLLWAGLLLALIRNYSGGGWGGDWYEHYHRTRFFLDRLPLDTVISGGYQVPARPPMMNLLAAHFLAHRLADDLPAYQIIFLFLNLLIFLPCSLVIRAVARGGTRGILILAALFALNPMFVQNVTYTWTKLLSGFYVVLAIWLYLAGWRKGDSGRRMGAFVCLAIGALVHYSVGPFIAFLAMHYTIRVFLSLRARWREFGTVAVASVAILGTWVGWSLAVYGREGTFASNTAVMAAQRSAGSNRAKVVGNIIDTFVPHPMRRIQLDRWKQPNEAGYVRDYAFLIYQTNFIAAMGAVGGFAIIWLFAKSLSGKLGPLRKGERLFWLFLTVFCTIVGIAVVGERERFGVAHICLPPLVFMGLALLAGNFGRLVRPAKWLLLFGCVVDFVVGIMLHFHLQTMVFTVWRNGVKNYAKSPDGEILSNFALGNWVQKTKTGAVFLGDLLADYSGTIELALIAIFILAMMFLIRAALNRGLALTASVSASAAWPGSARARNVEATKTRQQGTGRRGRRH